MKDAKKPLLVIEDDVGIQSQLKWSFEGFKVEICGNREDGIAQFRRLEPGVVLLDLGLPPDPGGVTEGIATLKEILSLKPETKVIIVTGDNDRANAVNAIGIGAYDFYQKPIDPEILTLIVERAYSLFELELENKKLLQRQQETPLNGIVTSSPNMLKVCRTVEKIAPSDITTLLLGASGTGKELVARAIHELSPRADQRMVAINCAAIPDTLLESELFGYEKGAFTGASKQTLGKIEYANGGTLFLDEIGDLPLELQAKLLRFLQERVIERLGGRTEIPVDVRIVCATHQNLHKHIEEGRFREDLFYRISELTINIPSLKEREGDALLLAKTFLKRFSDELGGVVKGFDQDSIEAIEAGAWPGNVRELESLIKRAVVMCEGSLITLEDLGLDSVESVQEPFNLRQVREDAELKAVKRALLHADGNVSNAAKMLGVTRPTLYSLLDKFDLKSLEQREQA